MPELIHPTSIEFKGPFLVDAKSLRELDTILQAQLSRLKEAQEELVPKRAEDKMARFHWMLSSKPHRGRVREISG
jgi:hypothetical protein